MLYWLHGLIFGPVTRTYGQGRHAITVTTFVGQAALDVMLPTGFIPKAHNDNTAEAA